MKNLINGDIHKILFLEVYVVAELESEIQFAKLKLKIRNFVLSAIHLYNERHFTANWLEL